MPDASVVKLAFAYRASLFNDATTGWTFGTVLNVRVNNLYSPVQGAQQPYGYDQMAALYRIYKVVGFKITVEAATRTSAPIYFGMRPVPVNENLTYSATGVAAASEWPNSRVVQLPGLGGPVYKTTYTADIPRLLGITKDQFDADVSEYSASIAAAPNRYAYVQLAVAGVDNAAFAEVMVRVEYTVQYWQRITLGQS